MNDETGKRLKSEAHEMMIGLLKAGGITMADLKEFEVEYLSETHDLSAGEIKKIRRESGVSQPILAKMMNVSAAAIKQWERGERKPSGASLKLLNLIEKNGIDYLL